MNASIPLPSSMIALALLGGLLLAACWSDLRSHRIPNRLVLAGIGFGLACNALVAPGLGFMSAAHPGAIGPGGALAGLLTGFGVLVPLYLLRGMGAGDVKLMAMVGAFLGPLATVEAALLTLVVGGLLAAVAAAWNRSLRQAAGNVWMMLTGAIASGLGGAGAQVTGPGQSAGKMPYALAITGGTLLYGCLARGGNTLFA